LGSLGTLSILVLWGEVEGEGGAIKRAWIWLGDSSDIRESR